MKTALWANLTITILPVTLGKMNAIMAGNPAAVEIDEKSFGG
jgi:hypothetical protein